MTNKIKKSINYIPWLLLVCVSILYLTIFFTWYQYQSVNKFHFFDDSLEWLGMDKLGHFITSFFESWIIIELIKLCKQRINRLTITYSYTIISWGFSGFFLQLPIEIMDGFSVGYGFSVYDILANFLGSIAVIVQYLIWNEVKIVPKISFCQSPYAAVRPNLLGSNIFEQFLKDYNGQTYWLSFSPNLLLGKNLFPEWLSVAIGYGATGLVGGHDNVWTGNDGQIMDRSDILRLPQIYFSLDINVLKLKNNKARWVLGVFNLVKFPLPTIEFLHNFNFIYHLIYF